MQFELNEAPHQNCNHRHFLFCFQAVVSLTIRAATWLKSSRLRPGDALGWDLAGFFFSGLDAFLFPMPKVYAVHSQPAPLPKN